MNLSISDFKSHAEMLGRFANIREGAPEPTDRILVQFDSVLKFVAGDDLSTVIVDTGIPVPNKGKALVSARLLLQAAKTLRGKGDLAFELDGKGGAVLKTHTGGKVVLPRIADALPGWVRPSVESATALALEIPDGFWPDLSKVIGIGPNKHHWPYDHAHFEMSNGNLRMLWTDTYRWVEYELANAVGFATYKYMGSVPVEFLKSLKAFTGKTSFVLTEDRMEVTSEQSGAISRLQWALNPVTKDRLYDIGRPNGMRAGGVNNGATVNRKDFMANLQAVSGADPYGRVTVMVGPDGVKVYAYGHEREGSMTMAASSVQGRGFVNFNEQLATKLLAGLKDKDIEFYFPSRGFGPIQFKEGKWGWQLYLAPIAL